MILLFPLPLGSRFGLSLVAAQARGSWGRCDSLGGTG